MIAFVLAGGASLGAVQAGMAEVLLGRGIQPDLIVGSSVGAVNGTWLASHPGLDGALSLQDLWRSIRRRDVFPVSPRCVTSAVFGRCDHLVNAGQGRELIEMVIYAGLPPPMPEWQTERDKKNKFLHWLRSNGFLVVTKEGSPGDGKHYKANVDVLMAIDAVELSAEMRPDVVVLVTGDADFAHLALQLRRRGIRVEAAATAQTLGAALKGAVNEVIDLIPLFKTFEVMKAGGNGGDW